MQAIQKSLSVQLNPKSTTEIFANRAIQRSTSPSLPGQYDYGQFDSSDLAIYSARHIISHKDILSFLSVNKTFMNLPLTPYRLRVLLTYKELVDSNKTENPKIQFADQNGLKLKIKIPHDFDKYPIDFNYLKNKNIQVLVFPEIRSDCRNLTTLLYLLKRESPHITSLSFSATIYASFEVPQEMPSIEEISFSKISEYAKLDLPSFPNLSYISFQEQNIKSSTTLSQLQSLRAQVDTKQKAS